MKKPMTWRPAAIGAAFALLGAALVPGVANAADGEEASIGDELYPTLAEAVEDADNGDTITLLDDAEIDEALHFDGGHTLTLDLNGYTITSVGARSIDAENVNLTITGGGTIKAEEDLNAALRIYGSEGADESYTVVNIEDDVTLEGTSGIVMIYYGGQNRAGESRANQYNGMELNLDGANIKGGNFGIAVNGGIHSGTTDVLPIINIEDSHIESGHQGIYLAGAAETSIVESTVEGDNVGIELRAGSLTLTEATVEGGKGEPLVNSNDSGTSSSNTALAVSQHTTAAGIELTIESGDFAGGAALSFANPEGNDSFFADVDANVLDGAFEGEVLSVNESGDAVAGFITGGTFTESIAGKGFVSPDAALLVRSDGTSQVMTGDQAQSAAVASVEVDGETIYFVDEDDAQVFADDNDAQVVILDDGKEDDDGKEEDDDKDKPVGPQPVPNPVNLVDVSSVKGSANYTQFHNEIQWLADRGITKGWNVGGGKHEFRAHNAITREAMAAFMYRAAGSPAVELPATSPFADVTPQNTWFYKEIVWMNQQNISNGWVMPSGKNEFRPKDNITRDAMAAFMYRLAGKPAFTAPATSPFADTSKSNTQFYKEITWLQTQNVSNGWVMPSGKNEYRPYEDISRAAMAAFLNRYYERVV